MSQERMHPDDLRAIMAAIVAAPKGWVGPLPEAIDRLLVELARTGKSKVSDTWPEGALGRIEEWAASCDQQMQRAEKAEARVKELESYISVLVHGERNNDLVFALWNETCGGASADKAAADLRSMIANLENNLDNSKARVKELEDAIRFHQSSLVDGYEVDRQLWLKVK